MALTMAHTRIWANTNGANTQFARAEKRKYTTMCMRAEICSIPHIVLFCVCARYSPARSSRLSYTCTHICNNNKQMGERKRNVAEAPVAIRKEMSERKCITVVAATRSYGRIISCARENRCTPLSRLSLLSVFNNDTHCT